MDIFKIIFILVVIAGIFLNYDGSLNNNKRKKRFFCIFLCLLLAILSAIRGNSVGTDTYAYISEYYEVSKNSVSFIFNNNSSCYLYYILAKLFYDIGMNVHIWFFAIALLFNSAVFTFIYKYSKDVNLSFILYIALGSFAFSLAGLKQTCAMAFCMFAFIIFSSENFKVIKKIVLTTIFMLLAIGFHQTAIFFVVFLLITKIKLNKKNNILFISIFLIILLSGNSILKSFIMYLDSIGNRFGYYVDNVSDYSLTMFFIQFLLIVVCLFYYQNLKKEKYGSSIYSLILGDSFYYLTIFVSSMFRMGYYVLFLNYILYPNVLENDVDYKVKPILKVGSGIVFILYFILFSDLKYVTMWG